MPLRTTKGPVRACPWGETIRAITSTIPFGSVEDDCQTTMMLPSDSCAIRPPVLEGDPPADKWIGAPILTPVAEKRWPWTPNSPV